MTVADVPNNYSGKKINESKKRNKGYIGANIYNKIAAFDQKYLNAN